MEGGSGQPRILVVSGDPLARDIHAQFLRMAAYDVVLAETGERALLMLRELPRRIDWLFTATTLPGLVDGWMLAHEFHRGHPTRTVILAFDAAEGRSLADGSMLFLPDLVSPTELVAQLHRLTGRTERQTAVSAAAPPLVATGPSVPPVAPLARRRTTLRRAAS